MKKNITIFVILCVTSMLNISIRSMCELEQLPAEIFEEIIQYLPKNDIKNLQLTSQTCKKNSDRRWNTIKLYINFPEKYGIEQVGTATWRITSCDGKHSIVNDLRLLTMCRVPGCTSKYKNRFLSDHLRYISANVDTHQQHNTLNQLLHFLYIPLKQWAPQYQKNKSLTYAMILNDSINKRDDTIKNQKKNSKLAQKLLKQKQFTDAQKMQIITWYEKRLESLQSEKEKRQHDRLKRKNIRIENNLRRQQDELKKQQELEKETELKRKKELERQKQSAKSTQTILDIKTRSTSPSEQMLFQALQTQAIQKKQSASPFAPVPIQIAIPRLNFTGYHQTRHSDDLESDIGGLQRLVMSAYTIETAQSMVLLAETETYSPQQKKRDADFPEDEPANKFRRMSADKADELKNI